MKLNYKDFTHLKKCSMILLSLLLIANNMGFGGWGIAKEVSAASIESWTNITNKAGLLSIQNNLSGNYRLMANIDLVGENWTSLGEFTGKLDGNSKSIINIAVTNTTAIHQGLFSSIGASGQVYNLGIEGSNITGGDYTGILAGVNHGTINRTYAKGSISGNEYVGGLVGSNTGNIKTCFSSAYVSGKDFVGGLVGANSGTIEGSYSSSEISASVFNNYLHFDGSTGYIQIPHHASYATDAFTLEAWFQWEGVETDNVNFIISKGFEQFEIHTGGGSFTNGIRFIPTSNNAGDSYLDARNVMQTGWFHVAAVYQYYNEKAISRVYINGIAQDLWQNGSNMGTEVSLARDANPLAGNSLPIDIGRRSDNTYYFQGKIADVRFWNTARSTEQIQTNKDRILNGNEAGLVGYWKLNEANGTVAIDSTVNSNNGTLNDGVTRTTEAAAVQTGGLIGVNTGSVTRSYYDTQVSLQVDTGKGDPKTTAEMKNQATYTGWNFTDVWGLAVSVNNGYPNILPAYTVNFGITGGNGNLAAIVDAIGINSGDLILEDKSVVLTATPDVGYRVKTWTVGGAIVPGETGNTYTLTNLLDAAIITIEFELIPTATPTNTPTNTSTATPTDEPTNTPTSTNTPTNTPTNTSTATPTDEPTNTPTPTDEPTNTSTSKPSSTPTPIPAKAPTSIATTVPTAIPTAAPTETPTAVPLSDIRISGDRLDDTNKDTDLTKDIKVGILIDGKKKDDTANASVQVVDKKVIVTVMVDKETAMDKLKEAQKVVTIPVSGQLDKFVGQLYGDMFREVEKNAAIIEIKTDAVTYSLPAAETRIESVAKQFGDNVEVKDIIINISIEKPVEEVVKVIETIANNKGFSIIASPLEFKVEATYGEKSIEIDRFESYVKRAVVIPDGVDSSRITTGVVVDSDGVVRHVPTRVEVIDGKYYAVINSLTNSTYSVIWNPLEYKDVENHWAKVDVNDMASRMVISGIDNRSFEPDKGITRAEFAVIIVKALGLKPGMGKNPFTDVDSSDRYKKYIDTAFEYNIIYGHKNGKFGSMEILTREQAMTMIARAMRITGLRMSFEDIDSSNILSEYKEVGKITSWAKESVAVCVDTEIVTGRVGKTLAPKDNITRAEVSAIVRRLLQKSNLY